MTDENTITAPKGTVTVVRPVYDISGSGVTMQTQETEIREIETPLFDGPVAYVRVGSSLTKNMGNFNSIKADVSVTLPCYATEEEVIRVADIASDLVHNILYAEVENAIDRDSNISSQLLSRVGAERSVR